jgi:hypothetical protein
MDKIDGGCVSGPDNLEPAATICIARSDLIDCVGSSSRSDGIFWMQGMWMSFIAEVFMQ